MMKFIFRIDVYQGDMLVDGAGFARQAATPFGAVAVGDWITIGDIPSREESRQTTGRVRRVSHVFSEADGVFLHETNVSVDAADPLRGA